MTVPELFKRLSSKVHHKRVSSSAPSDAAEHQMTSSRSTSGSASPPHTAQVVNDSVVLSKPATEVPRSNGFTLSSSEPSQGKITNGTATNGHAQTNGNNVHFQGLSGAAAIANKDPEKSKTDQVLEKIENTMLAAQSDEGKTATMTAIMKTTLDMTGGTEAIEQGVSAFVEGSAYLMKTLDEVAKLHPFVGVAVMAFKAVWTLEMKRRENDKKILALHFEMRDMMAVLVQLKDIRDPEEVAYDGSTIKGRMQELANSTADDIKGCANACDTYSKKKLIVKVLNGPIWEGRLAKFGGLFTKRRTDFEFALSIHTAVGVDTANRTLGHVKETTEAIDQKVDAMMKMFQSLMSSDERELTKLVNKKGGSEAIRADEGLLRELSKSEMKMGLKTSTVRNKAGGKPYSFEDLQDDLHADPDTAIKKNLAVFSRKFEVQQNRILEETKAVVKREGDRVIQTLTEGPHDRLVDPDIHSLWKEMRWRGSVKSRYFMMALRDYFHEKWGSEGQAADGHGTSASANQNSDEWALVYLNVQRLQPITESFDDDASGFITVAEVNTFTTARPLHWSLPHWIAFWAIGWHQSLAHYAARIRETFAKMFAILPHIHPANRSTVHKYLSEVYQDVTTVEAAVNPCFINEALQAKFRDHLDAEEVRLKKNLETVRYDIDAMDTLALITGAGRIGKFAHALLYLLLKHHFEIFRICKDHVIHPDELWDAAGSIDFVMKAFRERHELLKSIFRQQRLDPKQQFTNFAHGMFQYLNDPAGLWAPELVKAAEFPDYPYDDNMEEQGIKIYDILNYPADQQQLDVDAYGPPPEKSPEAISVTSSPIAPMLGPWNGYMYRKTLLTIPSRGMISMTMCASSAEDHNRRVHARSRSNWGDFTMSGQCSPGEQSNIIDITMRREFDQRYPTQYWKGQLDVDAETITGTWGTDPDCAKHQGIFILKRTAPEDLRFRPAPVTLKNKNLKAHALWSYALSAVQCQVRRKLWSLSYFEERMDNKKRFIELYIRNGHYGRPLDADELMEFRRVRQSLTAADSRFYHSFADFQIRKITGHGVKCANCRGSIGGSRIICLVCQAKNTWNTVDLCENPDCVTATVKRDYLRQPHLSTHDVVKVSRVVYIREFGKLERQAKQGLERARAILEADGTSDLEATYDSDYPSQVDASAVVLHRTSSMELEPSCTICQERITPPCWYYLNTNVDRFICDKCEANGGALCHDGAHDLVRYQVSEPTEKAPSSVEDKLANLEERFITVDTGLRQLDSKVDTRLQKVEELLHSVLGKLKPEAVST